MDHARNFLLAKHEYVGLQNVIWRARGNDTLVEGALG